MLAVFGVGAWAALIGLFGYGLAVLMGLMASPVALWSLWKHRNDRAVVYTARHRYNPLEDAVVYRGFVA
jgi:hypothetical protein